MGSPHGESGGHPPDSVLDTDLYTYEEGIRLPAEVRLLSEYAKAITSPNSIAVFLLADIVYCIGNERVGAAGKSLPPNSYHDLADYPFRNLVLLEAHYESYARIPEFRAAPLGHELEQILLSSGAHDSEREARAEDADNHCSRMSENLVRLYGQTAVPDPGPPGRHSN